MEHFASTLSLPLAAPSPHRRAWLSALALGIAGFIIAAAGRPLPTGPAPSEPAAAPVSEGFSFASGCASGDAIACNNLGVTSLHSAGSDPTLAVRSFERACQNGSADGCSNLGALYEHGTGVRSDLSQAAALYEQACDGGAALGCSNLGALYARGKGVARDASQARRLFTQACETASAAGCNNLMRVSAR